MQNEKRVVRRSEGNLPSLSIIVPVYNVASFLDKCLQSICSQSFPDFEVILINDGSTDSSLELCQHWVALDKRIHLLSQSNKGLAAVRNRGIREARAQQIMFVDSDDYLAQDAVERLMTLKAKSKADIAIGGYVYEDVGGHYLPTPSQLPNGLLSGRKAYLEVLYDNLLQSYVCMKIFDKKLFQGVEFPDTKYLEDYQTLYLVYPRARKVAVTNAIVYHYVVREGSITNDRNNWLDVHLIWLKAYKVRYLHGMTSGLLSRRERAFYRIFCIRQLARVNSWIAWSLTGKERPAEQVAIAKKATLDLLSFVCRKDVSNQDLAKLVRSTVYKKALVTLFCW